MCIRDSYKVGYEDQEEQIGWCNANQDNPRADADDSSKGGDYFPFKSAPGAEYQSTCNDTYAEDGLRPAKFGHPFPENFCNYEGVRELLGISKKLSIIANRISPRSPGHFTT